MLPIESRFNHRARKLRFETMKHRRVLAPVTVDTVDDEVDVNLLTINIATITSPGGAGPEVISLREAIAAANNSDNIGGPDEITFDPTVFPATGTHMIQLGDGNGTGEIAITDALTITGPSNDPNVLTIIADANSRIFNINYGTASADPVAMTGPVHCR